MKCRKETHRLPQEGGASSAHGNVPDRISLVNFVDQLLEGKLAMPTIRKQITGFVTSAKRIVLPRPDLREAQIDSLPAYVDQYRNDVLAKL